MLFYFDTIFFGWCTTRSFVLLSSVLNSLCIIFRKNNLWNKNNEKKWSRETEEEWELWKNERNADERRQKRNERTNEIKKKWLCSYENYAYHKL